MEVVKFFDALLVKVNNGDMKSKYWFMRDGDSISLAAEITLVNDMKIYEDEPMIPPRVENELTERGFVLC